ncbi:MAG TPA: ABC transporter permease, partial [Acidimicrobiia bacterium]|nr:ABC transporter permease [Acidimicrobiia bacterium]
MSDLRPRLSPRDLVEEALASLTARPGRAVLTALGTVLGVAALVATLGLSKTAGNQIVGRFDALAATDIVVTPKAAGAGRVGGGSVLPWDAEQRVARLNGVVAGGTLSDVDLGGELIRSVPVNDPVTQTEFQLPVRAASPGLWPAVRARLAAGRLPDAGHSVRGDRVAVVGANVAEQLHATRIEDQPAIFLGDKLYTVIGVLEAVSRQASLLGSVVIPEGAAQR